MGIAKFAQQALDEIQEALDKLDDAVAKHKELRAQMVEEIRLNKVSRAKQQEKSSKEQEKKEKEERRDALIRERKLNVNLQNQLKDTYEKEKKDRAEEIGVVGILINIVQKRLVK